MPRRLLRRLLPRPERLRERWIFRAFGSRLTDAHLWSLGRRSITVAFGTGLAISFIPLPIHVPLALLVAIVRHLNVPVIVGATLVTNPVTAVPLYYMAYRVGSLIVGPAPGGFAFELSWAWLQNGLGPVWKPFLVGCLVCAIVVGYGGYLALELLWRIVTVRRLRLRRATPPR
jgi:uncharacterized protein (DUF2062 family)